MVSSTPAENGTILELKQPQRTYAGYRGARPPVGLLFSSTCQKICTSTATGFYALEASVYYYGCSSNSRNVCASTADWFHALEAFVTYGAKAKEMVRVFQLMIIRTAVETCGLFREGGMEGWLHGLQVRATVVKA